MSKPPTHPPGPFLRTGLLGLYLTFLSARLVPALAYVGVAVMDLAFLAALPRVWRRLAAEPFVWLAAAFVLYCLALALAPPAGPAGQWSSVLALLHPWLLVIPAWWLGARLDRILWVLGIALAGFLVKSVYVLVEGDLWGLIAAGQRSGLGMSAIPFGLYSATAALGLLLLAPRLLAGRWRAARVLAWALALALSLEGLILSQSRNTWLAWLLTTLPLLWWRYRGARGRAVAAAAALVAVLAVALVGANRQAVETRLGAEWDTARAVLQGELERVPSDPESSLGVRAHLYRYAVDLVGRRPWFGWGPASNRALIRQHPNPVLHRWTHLHSTYLEILVRLGLAGALFYAAGAILLLRGLGRARREGRLPRDLHLFLLGVFAMTALWALTDSRLGHADWNFYWLLFGGIACSYRLHPAAGPRPTG